MRRLYLFRHARPDFPLDTRLCIGSTDIPLGAFGRIQAAVTAYGARELSFSKVFCSSLSRSRSTAEYLSNNVTEMPGLEEMHSGAWEGLDFKEIRERWPEIFRARGRDMSIPIPGAEDNELGADRFIAALRRCLAQSQGDIAVVGHATCNQSLICRVKGLSAYEGRRFLLPYCSLCVFDYDGDFHLESMGQVLTPPLSRELCLSMLHAAGLPESVREHCLAVSREALSICEALNERGAGLDRGLIESCALLHDIARREKEHDKTAALWLSELGYTREADIIGQHHGLSSMELNEAAVVYIADKLISGSERVSIERRFEKSLEKCDTPQAKAAHAKRREQALYLRKLINEKCERTLIP